ncbi:MAG TPA: DUF1684 domain-containing protein [candidate division Zixibacteria bacterium]|nr:DUF1684 domain-containing protein [candidate division Zixibacteria bacterium]
MTRHPDENEHRAEVETWRAARDARLRDPDGWLTLVGLHWLVPGDNRFGTDASNEIVLRGRDVPAHGGTIRLEGDAAVLLRPDGTPALDAPLADDTTGEPTVIDLGSLRMYLIRRGGRLGLRVRDHDAPALRRFPGMRHFPCDASWRVVAHFEPAPRGATLEVVDVIGLVEHHPMPGTVVFEREGREWRLDALPGGENGELWLIFGDATNGRETYGGGRFLYTEPPAEDGTVVVDFNLAYNPPCVFTPYATCPLPPPQNRLALAIRAGELIYTGDHEQ